MALTAEQHALIQKKKAAAMLKKRQRQLRGPAATSALKHLTPGSTPGGATSGASLWALRQGLAGSRYVASAPCRNPPCS